MLATFWKSLVMLNDSIWCCYLCRLKKRKVRNLVLNFILLLLLLSQKIVSLGQLQQFINSFLLLELQQLFSNLKVARDQKKFVTSDEFEQLQKKYMN